jgi:hypothetical protein
MYSFTLGALGPSFMGGCMWLLLLAKRCWNAKRGYYKPNL